MSTIYDGIFPMGLGTNRFPVKGPDDEEGIEKSVSLVVAALEAGVSYVDVFKNYSRTMAPEILRRAFLRTKARRHVTVKASLLVNKSSDDAFRCIESVFDSLGINHAFCFMAYNVKSYDEIIAIRQKGALYEGAVEAKKRGLVDHVCFSTHMPPKDIIRTIEDDMFEGVTISFSVLNSMTMQPVLEAAQRHGTGVVVMNPLGGGFVSKNEEYFSFLKGGDDRSVAEASLRFVYAHPAVKVVLSGISSMAELTENFASFREPSDEKPKERIFRVNASLKGMEGICTGCRYCDGCPKNVPIYEIMQAYNTTFFPRTETYHGRSDPEFLKMAGIWRYLKKNFDFLPETPENPCIKCGRCEKKCSASLPIIKRLEEVYDLFDRAGFSKQAQLNRLRELVGECRKVAFYPGGDNTAYVIERLYEAFPKEQFEISVFDTNPATWGMKTGGIVVRNPEEILSNNPEIIIVSHHIYQEEIYQGLVLRIHDAVPIVKLYRDNDVPYRL